MVKSVTLYPGRYAFICPCGHPYEAMTIYRKTSNIAVYCFACKQQNGQHVRIMEQSIDFPSNLNNKLNGSFFTTIRPHNLIKYCVGNILGVTLKLQPVGKARIIQVKTFTIDQINDYIACLDTGLQAEECKRFIKDLYKGQGINWNVQILDFCLLEYLDKKR